MADPILVPPEDVLDAAGLEPPYDDAAIAKATRATRDAQVAVQAYLGRPLVPRQYVETGREPRGCGRWNLDHFPVLEIVSAVAEQPTIGCPVAYTVTYVAGIDAVNDPDLAPILTYVRDHAAASRQVIQLVRDQRLADSTRRTKTISVEGQTITYDDADLAFAKPGEPGGPMTLKDLDLWRIAGRKVRQRHIRPRAGWPYTSELDVESGVFSGPFDGFSPFI